MKRATLKYYGLQQVLAATPIIFCGWLAMYARTYRDPFEFQAGSQEQDCVVLEYEPYVREQQLILRSRNGIDRDRMLILASRWDYAVKSHRLKPIKPISFEDSCATGSRAQVFRAKSEVVSFLLNDASRLANNRRITAATDETILALRLSESLKYGSFESITSSSGEQRRAMNFLSVLSKDMSNRNKREALRAVISTQTGNGRFLAALQESNARYYDFKTRFGAQVEVSEIRQMAMIGRRMRAEGKAPKTLQTVRKNFVSADDQRSFEYLSDLRLAWRAHQETQAKAKMLIARLSN